MVGKFSSFPEWCCHGFQRHNEIRDALGDLASIAYEEVVREPVIREPNDQENVPALVADLSVRGVRQPQATTFFDVRVQWIT